MTSILAAIVPQELLEVLAHQVPTLDASLRSLHSLSFIQVYG